MPNDERHEGDSMAQEYSASSMMDPGDYGWLLKRMSMTFGKVEGEGEPFARQKSVAVREILDNGLDELRSGYGKHIRLSFFADASVEVYDSGRGIPVDTGTESSGRKVSGIYLALGKMRSGGKFSTDSKRYSSGLHGLGGSATIATARCAIVTVYRDGKAHQLHFKDWLPGFFVDADDPDSAFTPLTDDYSILKVTKDKRPKAERERFPTGTRIRWWFNDSVFSSDKPYDAKDITNRLRDTAFLVPDIYAEVYDELNPVTDAETGEKVPYHDTFHYPDGLTDLVSITEPDEPLFAPVILEGMGHYTERNVSVLNADGTVSHKSVERNLPIRIGFTYGTGYGYTMSSYVNTIRTKLGGVHETGFEKGLVKAFNERVTSMRGLLKGSEKPPVLEDYQEGLTVVLSVEISEPTFDGQSKDSISGGAVHATVRKQVEQMLSAWIAKHPDEVRIIAEKVVKAARTRTRQEKAREVKRAENEIAKSTSLPAKLVDCRRAGKEGSELYICEGDSARTSLHGARNGDIHAILPIRGKIRNAMKASKDTLLKNNEVQDIANTLGAGVGEAFDVEKMRYDRIFIATDADEDGGHIQALLLFLIWKLFRGIIDSGRLYAINTPLFVIETKGKGHERHYAMDVAEKDELVAELKAQGKQFTLSRLKGLGEVPEDIMADSAFDPEHRVITQVVLTEEDVAELSERVDFLTNDKRSAERREWISESIDVLEEDDEREVIDGEQAEVHVEEDEQENLLL